MSQTAVRLSGVRVSGALPPFTYTRRTCDIFFNLPLESLHCRPVELKRRSLALAFNTATIELLPQGRLKCLPDRRVRQGDRRREDQQNVSGRAPAREVQGCRTDAVAERAEHRIDERALAIGDKPSATRGQR
jgi:hypothetical protein